ncbi:hypothetical protein Q9966_000100 [Columba livia]|nr:hypothetical protein Q9966_000100 [Columba livia]
MAAACAPRRGAGAGVPGVRARCPRCRGRAVQLLPQSTRRKGRGFGVKGRARGSPGDGAVSMETAGASRGPGAAPCAGSLDRPFRSGAAATRRPNPRGSPGPGRLELYRGKDPLSLAPCGPGGTRSAVRSRRCREGEPRGRRGQLRQPEPGRSVRFSGGRGARSRPALPEPPFPVLQSSGTARGGRGRGGRSGAGGETKGLAWGRRGLLRRGLLRRARGTSGRGSGAGGTVLPAPPRRNPVPQRAGVRGGQRGPSPPAPPSPVPGGAGQQRRAEPSLPSAGRAASVPGTPTSR